MRDLDMYYRQMGGVNLDLDATFLIQLVVIIIAMLVLRKLVFQPYLRVAQIRQDLTENTNEKAQAMQKQAEAISAEFESKLQQAKENAALLKGELRESGLKQRDEILLAARTAAAQDLEKARKRLEGELATARGATEAMVSELTEVIVKKLIGDVAPLNGASPESSAQTNANEEGAQL